MGADIAFVVSGFIATAEAKADLRYKQAIVEYSGTDIVYSNLFTGVPGNYLRASIEAAGFDPDHLPQSDPSKMNFGSGGNISAKAWTAIWGCGQGIGGIKSIVPAAALIARFQADYQRARTRLLAARGRAHSHA